MRVSHTQSMYVALVVASLLASGLVFAPGADKVAPANEAPADASGSGEALPSAEGGARADLPLADTVDPVTNIYFGAPNWTGANVYVSSATEFNLTAYDADSGVNNTWYRIWDGGAWTVWTNYSVAGNFTLPGPDGPFTIEYNSTDYAANVETTNSTIVHVDDTDPVSAMAVNQPKSGASPTYVTNATEFNLTVTEAGSGVKITEYQVDSGGWVPYTGNFTVTSPGAHTIYYNSTDNLGNGETSGSTDIFVDDVLPVSTLTVGDPEYGASPTYVTSSTEFNITVAETGSGLNYTQYQVDAGGWTPYTVNFTVAVPGAHTIYYNSTDLVGQGEATQSVDIFVDDTDPVTTLAAGDPKHGASPVYVLNTTEFNLTTAETGSGLDSTWYRVDGGVWTLYLGNFTVTTPGAHTLYWNSTDNLGQVETTSNQDIFVDTGAPTTNIVVGAPSHGASPVYVNSTTTFTLNAADGDAGVASTWYRVDTGAWTEYTGAFTVTSPGAHNIFYNSTDNVGNAETSSSTFIFVDDTLPVTTLNVGLPSWGLSPTYVTNTTELNLTASETGAGLAGMWYRVDVGVWTRSVGNFTLAGSGPHKVEYNSTDNLGQVEATANATFFIDDIAPTADISIGDPQNGSAPVNVTASTEFEITGDDYESGIAVLWFMVDAGPWALYPGNFTLDVEDGLHTIAFYPVDNVGNAGDNTSMEVYVDDTAPATTVTVKDPKHGTSPIYVTNTTAFQLNALDAWVGVDTIWYSVDTGPWTLYNGTFTVAHAGPHYIYYNATDLLGNAETTKALSIYVDDEAPEAVAIFDGPTHGAPVVNVTGDTNVTLFADDGLGSGVAGMWYRIDNGTWVDYNGSFALDVPGAHSIEYFAEDNLTNAGDIVNLTIYVDAEPPASKAALAGATYGEDPYFITSSTIINLTSADARTVVESIWYRLDLEAWTKYAGNITMLVGGAHTIQYYGVDSLGNIEEQRSLGVVVDDEAPTTYLLIGEGGARSGEVSVTPSNTYALMSFDTGAGVADSWYRVDTGNWTLFSANFTLNESGVHTIQFYSTDNLGNQEAAGSTDVNVVAETPLTRVFTGVPIHGTEPLWVSPMTPFSLEATSLSAGIDMIWYSLDGGATWLIFNRPFTLMSGITQVLYGARDMAGSNETAHVLNVSVDGAGPNPRIVVGAPRSTDIEANVTFVTSASAFNLTAVDTGVGLKSIWYSFDNASDILYDGNFTIAADGNHTITYFARDHLDNVGVRGTLHVIVDNIGPDSASLEPGDQGVLRLEEAGQVTLIALDDVMDDVTIYYSLDNGIIWQEYTAPIDVSGDVIILYYSEDSLGNKGPENALDVRIGEETDGEGSGEDKDTSSWMWALVILFIIVAALIVIFGRSRKGEEGEEPEGGKGDEGEEAMGDEGDGEKGDEGEGEKGDEAGEGEGDEGEGAMGEEGEEGKGDEADEEGGAEDEGPDAKGGEDEGEPGEGGDEAAAAGTAALEGPGDDEAAADEELKEEMPAEEPPAEEAPGPDEAAADRAMGGEAPPGDAAGDAAGAGDTAGAGDAAGAGDTAGAGDAAGAGDTAGAGDAAGAGDTAGAGDAAGAGDTPGAGDAAGGAGAAAGAGAGVDAKAGGPKKVKRKVKRKVRRKVRSS